MFPRSKTHRIFGPKIRVPTWQSAPLQRGSGFGSFFAKMGRKLMPLVKKAIPMTKNVVKKIANSKSVQEIGNSLLEKGVDAAATIAGNIIAGDDTDNLALAQERLASARSDIANIIRKAPKRLISESEESDTEITIPLKKKRKKKTVKVPKNKKKYNLLNNIK
jgi:hypothetical protein